MKLSLLHLFTLLVAPFFSLAQQSQHLKYANINPPTAKPLHMFANANSSTWQTHGHNLCKEAENVAFATHLRNTGTTTITNIVFRGILYDHLNNVLDSVESIYASLPPGDSVMYFSLPAMQLPAGGMNFLRVEFFCLANNITKSDFLQTNGPLSINMEYNDRISLDFGQTHNAIGTALLEDNAGIGVNFNISTNTDFNYIGVNYSSITIAGGNVIVEVYDSAGFSPIGGFANPPLFSKTFSVGSNAAVGNYVKYSLIDSQGNPLSLTAGSYYCVVYMQSQGGQYPIAIYNDQTMRNDGFSSIMYVASHALWFTGFVDSRDFNSPHIRIYADMSTQTSCTTISVEDLEVSKFSIHPNPATNVMEVSLTSNVNYPAGYSIYDLCGKKVQQGQLASAVDYIEVSPLRKGIYLLSLNDLGQTVQFVKN